MIVEQRVNGFAIGQPVFTELFVCVGECGKVLAVVGGHGAELTPPGQADVAAQFFGFKLVLRQNLEAAAVHEAARPLVLIEQNDPHPFAGVGSHRPHVFLHLSIFCRQQGRLFPAAGAAHALGNDVLAGSQQQHFQAILGAVQ